MVAADSPARQAVTFAFLSWIYSGFNGKTRMFRQLKSPISRVDGANPD
jgi:hypothetical protein